MQQGGAKGQCIPRLLQQGDDVFTGERELGRDDGATRTERRDADDARGRGARGRDDAAGRSGRQVAPAPHERAELRRVTSGAERREVTVRHFPGERRGRYRRGDPATPATGTRYDRYVTWYHAG